MVNAQYCFAFTPADRVWCNAAEQSFCHVDVFLWKEVRAFPSACCLKYYVYAHLTDRSRFWLFKIGGSIVVWVLLCFRKMGDTVTVSELSKYWTFSPVNYIWKCDIVDQFLSAFKKLWRTILASSCLSVRLNGTTWVSLDGFSRNLIFRDDFENL